jgi:hypothetical protein
LDAPGADISFMHGGDEKVAYDEPGLLERLMGDRALAEATLRRFEDQFPAQLRRWSLCVEQGDPRPFASRRIPRKGRRRACRPKR